MATRLASTLSSGFKQIDAFFSKNSYVDGYTATQEDLELLEFITAVPDAKRTPHFARWYWHINSIPAAVRKTLPADADEAERDGASSTSSSSSSSSSGSASKSGDDSFNLSGSLSKSTSSSSSSTEEETEEQKEARLAAEEKKRKYDEKIARNIANEKSNVIIDINPLDETTNLDEVVAAVRAIELDGLLWGSHEILPIAYGLKKIRMGSTIVNVKVGLDWMEEEIQKIEGVSSTTIVAFQKI